MKTSPRRAICISVKNRPLVTIALFVAVVIVGIFIIGFVGGGVFQVYGSLLGVILSFKLLLSVLPPRKFAPAPPDGIFVAAVIPVFNEDLNALMMCMESFEKQTRPVDKLFIVDDCSTDRTAIRHIIRWAKNKPWVEVILLDVNVGKRHAQAEAFRRCPDADIWVTVDSDTVMEPSAVFNGLRPFNDESVMAATGSVFAINEAAGIIPALIDLRYINAFLGERAAYSKLGSVVCACGSLSFWRGSIIMDNLDDFVNQTFLDSPAVFGDDRRLTRYALDKGKVVLARDSIARTAVPVNASHLFRQQIRWGKSFWRESYLMITSWQINRVAWWLTALELLSWLGFTSALIFAIVMAIFAGSPGAFLGYLSWIAITAWARSVHVFNLHRNGVVLRPIVVFLAAPIYGLLNVFVFLPLRLYSLLTLKSGSWGTRSKVEVRLP